MSFSTISVIALATSGCQRQRICLTPETGGGVDINQYAVDTINRGEIHIVEPDLGHAVKTAVDDGYLRASTAPLKPMPT